MDDFRPPVLISEHDIRERVQQLAARIDAALGEAGSVLNVGAGTGNYEPASRRVTALEPSAEMIAQRPAAAQERGLFPGDLQPATLQDGGATTSAAVASSVWTPHAARAPGHAGEC